MPRADLDLPGDETAAVGGGQLLADPLHVQGDQNQPERQAADCRTVGPGPDHERRTGKPALSSADRQMDGNPSSPCASMLTLHQPISVCLPLGTFALQ